MRKKLSPITHHLSPGFTLIELLVVISIIGILAALIMTNFNAARERARDAQRKSDLNQIKSSLQMYYNDHNLYPVTASFPDFGSPFTDTDVSMVYMKMLPRDPSHISGDEESPEYSYLSTAGTDYCLITTLENRSDQDIADSHLRCTCGTADNYVVCPD